MLFNSYEFIFLFLPISFFVYFYLSYKRLTTASKSWLVFASLFFYSWWNMTYLPLILTSILLNYSIAGALIEYDSSKKIYFTKKVLLQIGLLFNIGLLVYFKYMNFFIANINWSLNSNIPIMNIILPLGISFFTITQIAFLVDSYEGLVKERNFLNYLLFVTFFPHLLAGPILHHKEIMPQFASIRNKVKNYNNIAIGLFIFSIGLFKKVVIADTFAAWATTGFDIATTLNLFEAWATSLSYTFQLYFDFSGYTDMAIGAALLFNIKLPINFNSPYKATGMIDFWKRWHITLTNFITTYIYTPIVKSFEHLTFHKAMIATVITFLIAGLWHGASWMFVIFGGLNGIGIAINHYWQKQWKKKLQININKYIAWFITFNYVNLTLIFFRAKEWDDAIKVLSAMLRIDNIYLPRPLEAKLFMLKDYGINFGAWMANLTPDGGELLVYSFIVSFAIIFLGKNSVEMLNNFKLNYPHILFITVILFFAILSLNRISEFIYFGF